jgi:hypothetical protein
MVEQETYEKFGSAWMEEARKRKKERMKKTVKI